MEDLQVCTLRDRLRLKLNVDVNPIFLLLLRLLHICLKEYVRQMRFIVSVGA